MAVTISRSPFSRVNVSDTDWERFRQRERAKWEAFRDWLSVPQAAPWVEPDGVGPVNPHLYSEKLWPDDYLYPDKVAE